MRVVLLPLGVLVVIFFCAPSLRADAKETVKEVPAATMLVTPPAPSLPASTAQPLEFRGVLIDEDGEFFRITERETKKSVWVGLNETGSPFVVRHYDNRRQVIAVEYQGRVLTLLLKRSKSGPGEQARRRFNPIEHPSETDKANTSAPQPTDKPPASIASGLARHDAIRNEVRLRASERPPAPVSPSTSPETEDSK